MKRGVCTASGILGSLAGLIAFAVRLESAPDTPAGRVTQFMNVISYPFVGFVVPYAIVGWLLFSKTERLEHLQAASRGWRGFAAFTTLFLVGGHFTLLLDDPADVMEWIFTIVFLVAFFQSARSYLYETGRRGAESPNNQLNPTNQGAP